MSACNILITRPEPQASALADRCRQENASATIFSTLEIQLNAKTAAVQQAIQQLDTTDYLIFTSRNAVDAVLPLIKAKWPNLPKSLSIAAIGDSTAAQLRAHQCPVHIVPTSPFNSEALLADPALNAVEKKRIVLFCADKHRDLLPSTLQARGAYLDTVICYRVTCPEVDPTPLIQQWLNTPFNIVICTSHQSLCHLQTLLGQQATPLLEKTTLLVVSDRCAALAKQQGYTVLVSNTADNDSILNTLKGYVTT